LPCFQHCEQIGRRVEFIGGTGAKEDLFKGVIQTTMGRRSRRRAAGLGRSRRLTFALAETPNLLIVASPDAGMVRGAL
jgi:hypothetical protein